MGGERGYQEADVAACTPAGAIARRGVVTEVDIASLESASGWLLGLSQYVREKLVGEAAAKLEFTAGDEETKLVFGEFNGAQRVGEKHTAYYQAVRGSYEQLAKELEDISEGTDRIIANYKSVEERNRASVADITRILSDENAVPVGEPSTVSSSSTAAAGSAPSAGSVDREGGF